MTTTCRWTGTLTATSSIAHGGDTRGTITMLRRELIAQPDGRTVYVPIISGNTVRGRLRRTGEQLLREVLDYDADLTLPAAHALRSGGALAKTGGEPLSGRRLADLRALIPHIGVFGCAAGGRIVDGCLQVGKLVPHLAETAHITGVDPGARTAFNATQLETYVRGDDTDTHHFPGAATHTVSTLQMPLDDAGRPDLDQLPPEPPTADTDPAGASRLVFRVETFPAGTTFTSWIRLEHATDIEHAYFTDVLQAFTDDGWIGGRAGIGHGRFRADLTANTRSSTTAPTAPAATAVDWRAHLLDHRPAALTALQSLT